MKAKFGMVRFPVVFLLLALIEMARPSIGRAEYHEVIELRRIFQETVSSRRVAAVSYLSWMFQEVADRFTGKGNDSRVLSPQYFVFVDRNPSVQLLMVGWYKPEEQTVSVVGWDLTSTGDPDRAGHFITPLGMYEHSTAIIGYRSDGIPNEQGWLGNGEEGSRIWDFGWQPTTTRREGREYTIDIRLQIHGTDPLEGEPRLGGRDSQGCVRVSASLNRFLDHYGILDADYVANPHVATWLFKPDRETVAYPGRFMIVADSRDIHKDSSPLVAGHMTGLP